MTEIEVTWGGVTLGKTSDGDRINDWQGPSGGPVVQPRSALRRAHAGVFNRGNVTHRLRFTRMLPPFASAAAALQFPVDHAIALRAVTGNPDLEFTLGNKDYVMHHAVVTSCEVVRLTGLTVVLSYEITGGELEEVIAP